MINKLKKLLMDKYCCNDCELKKETEPLFLEEENKKLSSELFMTRLENEQLKVQLDTSLDEIVKNRQRINAILKQLSDKTGKEFET